MPDEVLSHRPRRYNALLGHDAHRRLWPPEVDKRVRQILAAGEPATLPDDVLKALNHRRLLAKQTAPWVEAHHTPGVILDLEKPDQP